MKKVILLALTTLMIFTFFAVTPSVVAAEDVTDPWSMPFCLKHEGCGRYQVRNQTDYWLQVYLMHGPSKEKGFFTIPPKGIGNIKLKGGGGYYSTFVYWCGGEMEVDEYGPSWPIVGYNDWFKCPGGYSSSVNP